MLDFLKKLFKVKDKVDFDGLLSKGAIVLDVRTKNEFEGAHTENTVNIPLNELKERLNTLDKNIPIITVCQSGMRSKMAKSILKQNGFTEVYNGGNWAGFK